MRSFQTEIYKLFRSKTLKNNQLEPFVQSLKGLSGSLRSLFISFLFESLGQSMLVIFPQREDAEAFSEELSFLLGEDKVAFFPGGAEDPESPLIVNPGRAGQQMACLRGLLFNQLSVVVTSARGALQKLPQPEQLKKECIVIKPGAGLELYPLIENLINFGYTRESMTERPGEISLRGGILDIFPYSGEPPHRIEFFGNEVESLRIFDVDSQRTTQQADQIILISSPLAWDPRSAHLVSYFPKESLLYLEDPALIYAEVENDYHREELYLFSPSDLKGFVESRTSLSHYTIASPKNAVDFGGRSVYPLGRTAAEIREQLNDFIREGQTCHILWERTEQRNRYQAFLEWEENPISGVFWENLSIQKGFQLPEKKLVVLCEENFLSRKSRFRRRTRSRFGVPVRELSSLKRGDYMVHVDHGIGQYLGLEKITVKGMERECLAVQYKDQDKLYVPVDKMERVQKYSGREGATPALSKLGSGRWERIKSRTRNAIKDIAQELIQLYSVRQTRPGFAFSSDTTWQKELELGFLFEETPDQSRAIEDVKLDMEKAQPMDRLICGDVGFGKTEVAIRAAFKAISDSKQAALLAPTTILVQQHFRTFQDRLASFPVTIEVLSRFRTRKEQHDIIEKLKAGQVDIVIGTHRLLSKDVGFKNLGLLIIDEEQRFGVTHKEMLKSFRKTVDVLTLSATPIPRTLQLSLTGIRDMSLINTPPRDRQPIITEVTPFHEEIIAEAIQQELARGGQTFFVHNRIQSIHAVARMIQRLIPGIRLAVAHGRMEERELEKVMIDFGEKRYDCLVATMIIESGLDIPNVNTLIVHRADRLGLGQLYQLRGRVGRSDKRAYAYLLTPPFHLLSRDAIKRLRTIEEFTELGSGIQIAMRDLEIRGAGNLLGAQQSGNIDAVGFDLYTQLVNEAVEELRREGAEEEKKTDWGECSVDLHQNAFLPAGYVPDESQRIILYRRLSMAESVSHIKEIEKELKDRFGPVPMEANALMDSAELRLIGQEKGIQKIILQDNSLTLYFHEDWVNHFHSPELFSEHLRLLIDSSPKLPRFLNDKPFGMKVQLSREDSINFTKKWLQSWG